MLSSNKLTINIEDHEPTILDTDDWRRDDSGTYYVARSAFIDLLDYARQASNLADYEEFGDGLFVFARTEDGRDISMLAFRPDGGFYPIPAEGIYPLDWTIREASA